MNSNLFGWAKVENGRVVRLSDAVRRPRGQAWGAVNTICTQVGDCAVLDGGVVYLTVRA